KHLNSKNWEGVRQAAHKMKPSLNYLGLKDGQKLAASIEEFALNKTQLEQIEGLTQQLNEICKAAFAELEEELKSLPIS
ncbi:MAG TPA: Hpt domain-containing protein, partial [Bacteroidia bacterium]|nr:Hpt domain-containing protein [Bacteroidia bacterium]